MRSSLTSTLRSTSFLTFRFWVFDLPFDVLTSNSKVKALPGKFYAISPHFDNPNDCIVFTCMFPFWIALISGCPSCIKRRIFISKLSPAYSTSSLVERTVPSATSTETNNPTCRPRPRQTTFHPWRCTARPPSSSTGRWPRLRRSQ